MSQKSTDCELRRAVKSCRSALMAAAFMSGMANVLMLTGSFFMLQVYDRVLPSRSVPTLVGLAILMVVLFAFLAAIDSTRARIMARVGNYLDGTLSGRAYQAGLRISVVDLASGFLPGRDLDQIRSFLQSAGPVAFFDLPWVPFYAALCFLFHPWIGYAVLLGAMLVTVPTLCTEIITRAAAKHIQEIGVRRQSLAEASRRNSEIILASGMTSAMTDRWMALNERFASEQQRISDVAGGFGAFTKALRLALQSGVLALGAYLVIQGESTSGIIIASSIIAARALAPIEQTIAHWKHFVAARQSFARLSRNLAMAPPLDERKTALPKPCKSVAVEGVSVTPPRAQRRRSPMCRSGSRRDRPSASSARAPRENPRLSARWSASGRRRKDRCASTRARWSNGPRRCAAAISDTCPRASSCWPARWRRTSAASGPSPTMRRSSPPRAPPPFTT